MASLQRTPRQRIMDLLTLSPMSSQQIAAIVKLSERQVEEHLVHITKSLARDLSLRFVLEPPNCRDCDFVFRDRQRLTRPSRCPRCHSEAITDPRYSIERRANQRDED
jgi:predicted Zn-ribbon and HTH transcriptional regulator